MRTIFYIIQKEFIQIFRDKALLSLMIIAPFAQLVILIYAANLEMGNVNFAVVDYDKTQTSSKLVNLMSASPFYSLIDYENSIDEAQTLLTRGEVHLVVVIPKHFEQDLEESNSPKLQLLIDAVNGTTAFLVNNYSRYIIGDFNEDIVIQRYPEAENMGKINCTYSYWYNDLLDYKIFMFPGLLVILVSLVGLFIAALNFVKEKELGNITQINVTAIKKYQFIAGKLIPFWIIGIVEFVIGLFIGKFFFNMPFLGSFWTLLLYTSIYLICVLSLGLFLASISHSQQQVMFFTFFFFLTFIILSGIFTPIETMPSWVKYVNYLNPFAYLMKVIRMILLKGSSFYNIIPDTICLTAYSIMMFFIAVFSYKKIS
ncbi:MAG: ABC transporter permease [Bacteroidales bacterium]|jgi:ABC-2 type transport system permease protein|nr:ABC transporter permease [Bacteroidales bacterium]MDD2204423.1 ABC transporter permease [Bacteroidales bacterium]MDD3152533.1 ABC transporter permease [Bacteroidales bacterium]MDD3913991.1 ABC transporter permease [Bacteroidales bacterium]MDD4633783.1 ABC transporter permease [Bacteroidales bacterium]